MKIYFDSNDWWIGVYRGVTHWYVCPIATLVIRINRRHR